MTTLSTYVYIVAPIDAESPCKIGISNNPGSRLASLQTGSPVPLRLVEIYGFETKAGAAKMEQDFHSSHSDLWAHGEWFAMPVEDANYWLFLNAVGPELDALGL